MNARGDCPPALSLPPAQAGEAPHLSPPSRRYPTYRRGECMKRLLLFLVFVCCRSPCWRKIRSRQPMRMPWLIRSPRPLPNQRPIRTACFFPRIGTGDGRNSTSLPRTTRPIPTCARRMPAGNTAAWTRSAAPLGATDLRYGGVASDSAAPCCAAPDVLLRSRLFCSAKTFPQTLYTWSWSGIGMEYSLGRRNRSA